MHSSSDCDPSMKYYTEDQLKNLDLNKIPKHIAMILDGNRRWARAKEKGKAIEGHRTGANVLIDVLKAAKELGIKYMTLYTFSTENWMRDPAEVLGLIWLSETYIREQTPEMVKNQIRFHTIGDISKFPDSLQEAIQEAKLLTRDCTGMQVISAMNYGARDEIRRAVSRIIGDKVPSESITEDLIASYLDTAPFPDPELLIRTGGEDRISNFLLWQLSYAEFYTSETLWPEFSPAALLEAVFDYQKRERRLGI